MKDWLKEYWAVIAIPIVFVILTLIKGYFQYR